MLKPEFTKNCIILKMKVKIETSAYLTTDFNKFKFIQMHDVRFMFLYSI